ncbi:MAG: hypothetical protein IKA03_06930 [Alphaproteobacteria bacterium]|nr:hypothetical protein [Alphaproteobacteria bacterium]
MKFIAFITALFFTISAYAQVQPTDGYMPSQDIEPYFEGDETNYNKSIIYIFFNNEPCYTCASAIEMIEEIYDRNFIDEYNMFMINYQNDSEDDFISTYSLSEPLEVVLVRMDDGAAFGYRKLENIQDMTSDPVSLEDYFVNQVNEFLGN